MTCTCPYSVAAAIGSEMKSDKIHHLVESTCLRVSESAVWCSIWVVHRTFAKQALPPIICASIPDFPSSEINLTAKLVYHAHELRAERCASAVHNKHFKLDADCMHTDTGEAHAHSLNNGADAKYCDRSHNTTLTTVIHGSWLHTVFSIRY